MRAVISAIHTQMRQQTAPHVASCRIADAQDETPSASPRKLIFRCADEAGTG
jgi:hypothetical protein